MGDTTVDGESNLVWFCFVYWFGFGVFVLFCCGWLAGFCLVLFLGVLSLFIPLATIQIKTMCDCSMISWSINSIFYPWMTLKCPAVTEMFLGWVTTRANWRLEAQNWWLVDRCFSFSFWGHDFRFYLKLHGVKVPRCRSGRSPGALGTRGFCYDLSTMEVGFSQHWEFEKWLFLLDDDKPLLYHTIPYYKGGWFVIFVVWFPGTNDFG